MFDDRVVVGPWPGSRQPGTAPGPRAPIPNRYIADKWGGRQLMDCRDCRTPFAPDVPVPRDRRCATCRGTHDQENPTLDLEGTN